VALCGFNDGGSSEPWLLSMEKPWLGCPFIGGHDIWEEPCMLN
jgi:hypothetical protein